MAKYRVEIDGLRAIAVLLVVAFHLEFSRFASGGFVGVDVFFVISGYLITGHLRRDIGKRYAGIVNFYHRRVIRIFPALFVTYLACALVELLLRFTSQLPSFQASLISSDFFVSNLYLYKTVGYFDFDARNNALIHTWSLSIEEQFYIFLPLALMLIRRLSERGQMIAITLLSLLSLAGAQAMLQIDARASFYWVPLRAWELLAGSILSYRAWPILARRIPAEAGALAGLAMILGSSLLLSERGAFPGLNAVPPVVGTMLILAATESRMTLVTRLLSLRPATFIGKISYSLYLWHWPIIVYSRYVWPAETRVEKSAIVFLSIAIAALSWWIVEQPVRRYGARRSPKQTLTIGLAAMALTALCALALPALSRMIWPRNAQAEAMLTLMKTYDPKPFSRSGICFVEGGKGAIDEARCLTPDPARMNVLLLGDSHAAHLWSGLAERYPNVNFMQATAGSCTPLYIEDHGVCGATMRLVLRKFLPHHRPDMIILSARWTEHHSPRLAGMLRDLKDRTPELVLFGPSPEYALPLPEAMARGLYRDDPHSVGAYLSGNKMALDRRMERISAEAGVRYVSLYRLMCRPDCLLRDAQGEIVMFDNDHLTHAGSVALAQKLPADLFTRK